MFKIGPQTQILRGFHTSIFLHARPSKVRKVRSVTDPPLQPAPKSEFFAQFPTRETYFNKDRFRLQAQARNLNESKEAPAVKPVVDGSITFQYGISADEAKFITEKTPNSIAITNSYCGEGGKHLSDMAKMTMKIVSLGMANSKQIRAFNVKQCIEKIGRCPNDTGSPEVQAAIWTLRIRNLEVHLETYRKDKHNRRRLVMLYHKRAKMLKYLKRISIERYAKILDVLGITQEMVEGEISIRQKHN